MSKAERIRMHGRERYVLPARARKQKRFSIRAGDVVHELNISGRAPAVCSALKSREFLKQNDLVLVESSGPKSGQSTTVTYTYEFIDTQRPSIEKGDAWMRLRGTLKDVFAEWDGGEAYLHSERKDFRSPNFRSPRAHR
jgi:hypothetical protein